MEKETENSSLRLALTFCDKINLPQESENDDKFAIAIAKIQFVNGICKYALISPSLDSKDRKYDIKKVFTNSGIKPIKKILDIYPMVSFSDYEDIFKSPYQSAKYLYSELEELKALCQKYHIATATKWDSMEEEKKEDLLGQVKSKIIELNILRYEEKQQQLAKRKKHEFKLKVISTRNKEAARRKEELGL